MLLSALIPLAAAPVKMPAEWFAKKVSPQLVNAEGKKVSTAVLKGKMVAFYFSAHWCGPCRSFTPQLVKFYKRVAKKNKFEIVFISSDKNIKAMHDYMKSAGMPWLAMPFKSPAANALSKELGVRGIPTLVVFDQRGRIIDTNGRSTVSKYGSRAIEIWKKAKPVKKSPAPAVKTGKPGKKGKK